MKTKIVYLLYKIFIQNGFSTIRFNFRGVGKSSGVFSDGEGELSDSEDLEEHGTDILEGVDAVLVPGGFGQRGIEGKISAARLARENKVPYLGICLGMQVAVIEYARNVAGLEGAHSSEFRENSPAPVVGLITEWLNAEGKIGLRDEASDLGGTMRLGGQVCHLKPGSKAREAYGNDEIVERHRHRFEVNNQFIGELEKAGLVISGKSVDESLVEMVELPDHPWFVACQFHPEFTSTPRDGHPLFSGFIQAALEHKQMRARQQAQAQPQG